MLDGKNYYLAIDIGGTKVAYGLFDEEHKLLAKLRQESDDFLSGEAYFDLVIENIYKLIAQENLTIDSIKGIGIGICGPVDFEQGALAYVASLPKLRNFQVVAYLKSKLGEDIRIVLDNDCHCGALAEYRHGAGRGKQHMLYCPVSTGISTGIVIDGKLFRGSNGASGETGHTLTGVEGPLRIACACGNEACFNSLCSGKGITEHIRRWLSEGETSIMLDLAGSPENISAHHISEAYDLGDAMAIKAVDQMAHYMAIWLFNVYQVFNIDCIVLSGGLLAMRDTLLSKVKEQFFTYKKSSFPVSLCLTELGHDSGLLGAFELLW